MDPWYIEYINEDAEREMDALHHSLKAKFIHITELIDTFGLYKVGMPHIKPLERKLWEIRMKSPRGIARSIFISRVERKIIILHTFIKKTQKTPEKAIEIAKRRLKEYGNDD